MQDNNEGALDIKVIVGAIRANLHFFILFIALALIAGFLVNRWTKRVYRVEGSLLLMDERNTALGEEVLLNLSLFREARNTENEMEVLTSRMLIEDALDRLDWKVGYSMIGRVMSMDIYQNSPFKVVGEVTRPDVYGKRFQVKLLDDEKFVLSYLKKGNEDDNRVQEEYRFGEAIQNDFLDATVVKAPDEFPSTPSNDILYEFWFYSPESLVRQYSNKVNVNLMSTGASVLFLSLTETVPERGVDFLNSLMEAYIELGVQEKSMTAANTITFLNDQLDNIRDSLATLEEDIRQFKSSNQIVNLPSEAQLFLEKASELDQVKYELQVQIETLQLLQDYVKRGELSEEELNLIIPSTYSIPDPVLNGLVAEFVQAYHLKESMKSTITVANPAYKEVQQRLQELQRSIVESVERIVEGKQLQIREIQGKTAEIEGKIRTIPTTELDFLRLQRKLMTVEQVFTFLQEKKAEAEIAKAATVSDNRVLEYATFSGPIQPNPRRNYLVALLVGLAIPSGITFLRLYLDNTIKDRSHLESLTDIPVIGSVGHNTKDNNLIILTHPKSVISEAFRSLRTNLQFVGKGEDEARVLLITSMISGEGKTFCAINLASVLAYAGKRVVVVGLDLRKPKIHTEFGIENTRGMSNYLIGQADLEEITHQTRVENLDLITAGPIPPNPSELILNDRMQTLIDQLQEDYDYVILDTPPIGLVTDASILMQHSDTNMFIVRHGYSKIDYIRSINDIYEEGKFSNLYLVLNDVDFSKGAYGYKYGYGYGYGYGYYEEDKQKEQPFWKRIFKS